MNSGAIVTPKRLDPANAIFRVVSVTRNGWLRCECIAFLRGSRPSHPYGSFRFRSSEMTTDIDGHRRKLQPAEAA